MNEKEQLKRMLIMKGSIQADAYDKMVKSRIQVENSIQGKVRDNMISEAVAEELYQNITNELRMSHDRVLKEMQKTVKEIPIYDQWLKHVKGIGPRLATKLIAYTQDIGRFPKVSMYWKWNGLAPVQYCVNCKPIKRYFETEIEKRTWINRTHLKQINLIGEDTPDAEEKKKTILKNIENSVCKCGNPQVEDRPERRVVGIASIDYNPKCKDLMYLLGEQFVRQGKFYRGAYDHFKEYEVARNSGIMPQGRIHNRAKRKTVKLFISHFWTKWRELEGLEITEPYVSAYMGHELIGVPEPGEDGKI